MQSSRHPPGAAKVFIVLASNTRSEECFAPYNRRSSSAGSGRLLGSTVHLSKKIEEDSPTGVGTVRTTSRTAILNTAVQAAGAVLRPGWSGLDGLRAEQPFTVRRFHWS